MIFLRPERELNPRIDVLQTPAFPLRHPAASSILTRKVSLHKVKPRF